MPGIPSDCRTLIEHLQKISSLALTENYDALSNYVVEVVNEITGAEVTLWKECEEANGSVEFLCISKHKGSFTSEFLKNARIPLASGSSITAEAIRKKEPVVRQNLQRSRKQPRFVHLEEAREHGWHSVMIVPLLGYKNVVLGSLALYSKKSDGISEQDKELILPFANQISIAWQQQIRASDLTKSLSFRESVFANAFNAIIAIDEAGLVREFNSVAREMMGYTKEEVVGKPVSKFYYTTEHAREVMRLLLKDKGEGKEGRLENHKTFVRGKNGDKIPILLSASLIDSGSVGFFSDVDLYSGVGFFKDLRDEEQEEELLRAGQAVMSEVFSYHDTLDEIARQAVVLVADETLDGCFSTLTLAEGEKLYYEAAYPKHYLEESRKKVRFIDTSENTKLLGITGYVFRTGKTLNEGNVKKSKYFFAFDDRVNSQLSVPIRIGNKVEGVLSVEHPEMNAFSRKDERTLEFVAGYAGIAINNARHVEELRRVRTETRKIATLITLDQDLQTILDLIVERIKEAIECDVVTLHTYNSEHEEFNFPFAMTGVSEKASIRSRGLPNDSTLHRILALDKLHQAVNAQTDEYLSGSFTEREHVRSALGIPLLVEGRKVGVMIVSFRTRHDFASDELSDIELFADLAAVVIDKARLDADVRRQTEEFRSLFKIGQALTKPLRLRGKEGNDLFKLIYDQVNNVIEAPTFFIALSDEMQKTIDFKFFYDYGEPVSEKDLGRREFRAGEGFSEYAITERKSFLITHHSLQKETNTLPVSVPGILTQPPMPESSMFIPLNSGGRTIGVLSAQNYDPDAFDEHDLELVGTIANQAAIAIDNARLYQEMEEKLEMASERIRKTEGLLISQSLLTDVLHKIPGKMGSISVISQELILGLGDTNNGSIGKEVIIEQLEKIRNGAESAKELAEEWDPLGKIDRHYPVHVEQLLRESTLDLDWENVDITFDFESNLPCVFGNPRRLTQAFANIVENGIHALRQKGGFMLIRVKAQKDESSKTWIAISITDDGPGISDEIVSQIFDLFFTRKNGGHGYGLWRAKTLIKSMDGRIDVSSKVGEGTTFEILLPAIVKRFSEEK